MYDVDLSRYIWCGLEYAWCEAVFTIWTNVLCAWCGPECTIWCGVGYVWCRWVWMMCTKECLLRSRVCMMWSRVCVCDADQRMYGVEQYIWCGLEYVRSGAEYVCVMWTRKMCVWCGVEYVMQSSVSNIWRGVLTLSCCTCVMYSTCIVCMLWPYIFECAMHGIIHICKDMCNQDGDKKGQFLLTYSIGTANMNMPWIYLEYLIDLRNWYAVISCCRQMQLYAWQSFLSCARSCWNMTIFCSAC